VSISGQRVGVLVAMLLAAPALWLLTCITPLSWAPHWPDAGLLLLGVLVAPVLEETVFRGGLQEWGIRRYGSHRLHRGLPSRANIGVSLLFAACHLWAHPPVWAAAMIIPSLVLGALYEQRRGLAAPITVHALYNAAYLILLG